MSRWEGYWKQNRRGQEGAVLKECKIGENNFSVALEQCQLDWSSVAPQQMVQEEESWVWDILLPLSTSCQTLSAVVKCTRVWPLLLQLYNTIDPSKAQENHEKLIFLSGYFPWYFHWKEDLLFACEMFKCWLQVDWWTERKRGILCMHSCEWEHFYYWHIIV